MAKWIAAAALALALAACGPAPAPGAAQAAAEAPAPVIEAAPAGPPVALAPAEGDPLAIQSAASVMEVISLQSGAKLFTTAGGDPAINGLYVYVAAFESVPEGWRVFQVADVNEMTLLADRGSDVVLEVSRSWVDEAGEIATARERMIVEVPTGTSQTIAVTPAR